MSDSYELQTDILLQADDFSEAYRRCLEGKNPKTNKGRTSYSIISIPAIVNAAFACELYMKSMIKEKGSKHGHDLKELFDNLDNKTQELIKQYANKCLESHPFYNFDMLLDRPKNVFVDWRYIYEKEHLDGFMGCFINENLMFFGCFTKILNELAHKVRF